jgi:sugar lactone lactonase YvrE
MVRTRFRILLLWFLAAAAGVTLAPGASAAPMTPAGWRVSPGRTETTVQLGPGLAGPWGEAISPDGRSVLVMSSGTAAQFESVERFDIASLTRTGLVWSYCDR